MLTFYVPTLNSAKTLKSCLESIAMQGIKKKDIYIIDSGSIDETLNVASSVGVNIIKERSISLSNGRNIAIRHCKTKYICFIDSDVILEKNWLDEIFPSIKDNIVGACGNLKETIVSHADKWREVHLRQNWGNSDKKNPAFLYGSNTIFLSDVLKEVGGYNQEYATNFEDVDISRRILSKGHSIYYVSGAHCHHMKRDTLFSVVLSARKWSFFSYDMPKTFSQMIKRIFIYNPHYFMNHLFLDMKKSRIDLALITLLILPIFAIYDLSYFFGRFSQSS